MTSYDFEIGTLFITWIFLNVFNKIDIGTKYKLYRAQVFFIIKKFYQSALHQLF